MPSLMKARSGVLNSNIGGNALAPLFSTGALTIANAITDVTRLAGVQGDGAAYPDSSVGVWPAATNLCTNGGFETNTTGWTTTGAGAITATRSTLKAKYGSASLLVSIDGTAGNQGARLSTGIAAATSTAYTCHMWVWAPTGDTIQCGLDQTLSNVYVSTLVSANAVGNDSWQQVILTGTTSASGIDGLRPFFRRAASGAAIAFYVDGVQLETGSIATPYIETDGGTASRSAGSITMPAGVLDETQMWVALRGRHGWTTLPSAAPMFWSWGDSANERMLLYWSSTTNIIVNRQTGGVGTGKSLTVSAPAVGDNLTLIGQWTATHVRGSYNGAAFTETNNNNIPSIASTTARIGTQEPMTSGRELGGAFHWFAAGLGILTDDDAALINSWGNNDPLPHMFPSSARLSFLEHLNGDGTFYRRSA